MYSRLLPLIALLFSACAPLRAQTAVVPSTNDCRDAANKLGSDPHSEPFRWAVTYGRLAACGDIGAKAIAAALLRPEVASDPTVILGFRLQAAANRNPAILSAALSMAANKNASNLTRVMGLELALRQHDLRSAFRGSLPELSNSAGELCSIDYVGALTYASEAPLPSDYVAQIATTMNSIVDDSQAPAPVRNLARCVLRAVRGEFRWEEEPS